MGLRNKDNIGGKNESRVKIFSFSEKTSLRKQVQGDSMSEGSIRVKKTEISLKWSFYYPVFEKIYRYISVHLYAALWTVSRCYALEPLIETTYGLQ